RPGSRTRRRAAPPSTRAAALPPTRSRGSASDGHTRAADSVGSLPRLRGRGGEGVACTRLVACPLPVPPPQAAEGTMWHQPSSREALPPFQLSPHLIPHHMLRLIF